MNEGMTSMIGKIVEFFPETQTATIQLFMNKIVPTDKSNFNSTIMAELIDVPCQFLKVSNFSITAPVKTGDTVIVNFMSCGITHWLYEEREEYKVEDGRPEPAAMRRYSGQDAVAYIGLSNMMKPIDKFNPDDLELRNEDASQRITMRPNGETEINSTLYDGETKTKETSVTIAQDGTYNSTTIDNTTGDSASVDSDSIGNIKMSNQIGGDTQSVEIDTSKAIILTTGDSVLTLNNNGTINLSAGTSVTLDTPTTNVTGTMNVTGLVTANAGIRAIGNVSASGNLSTDSRGGYNSHTHSAGTLTDSPGTDAGQVTGRTGGA